MTEAEWLACEDPFAMLHRMLSTSTQNRKLRLFAAACCRRIWSVLPDDVCRQAVEAAEAFADSGELAPLAAAHDAMFRFGRERMSKALRRPTNRWKAADSATSAAGSAAEPGRDYFAAVGASDSSRAAVGYAGLKDEWNLQVGNEMRVQAALLRDIFGNPFCPITFSPEWRTDTAMSLARQMYESRDFGAMPILADALQDAGRDSDDILAHYRDANQPHVRGCWVVDLVLGLS